MAGKAKQQAKLMSTYADITEARAAWHWVAPPSVPVFYGLVSDPGGDLGHGRCRLQPGRGRPRRG